jgi:radical SAM superfamily enzyme YgiQ (UPF0313 family)
MTMLELVKTLENKAKLKNVKGIAFRHNDKPVKTKCRPFISNLDSLPFPAYHHFDFNEYKKVKNTIQKTAEDKDIIEKKYQRSRKASIITSRGCPFKCQFCSISSMWGTCWRSRSPKNVVDEIELLSNEYKVDFFNLADDSFTIDQNRVTKICEQIIKRKLDIRWFARTRVDCVSKEMLFSMKKAGCQFLFFGVESGSSLILKTINKQFTVDQIIKAFDLTHQVGLNSGASFMIGNPNESEKTINETIKLIRRINPDFIETHITSILPGTPLYELAKQKGLVNDEYWLTSKPGPPYTAELSLDMLKWFEFKILLNFWKFKGIKEILLKRILKPQLSAPFFYDVIKQLI